MKDFIGKVAVITGAGRGIGRGIALRCAKEGMKVVLAGIGMESLTRTNADLLAMGAETLVVQTDVSKVEDVENLAQKSIKTFGEIHMLVNNAGVGHIATAWESSLDDWEWVIGVNLWGVIYGVRTFIPIMMKQTGECHVINVSSMNGVIPGNGVLASYDVAKYGVVALSESLYFSLASHAPHIKISVYIPGSVNTDILDCERNRPERFQQNKTPHQLSPEERANWDANFEAGLTIEEAASVLFDGIKSDTLYIGAKGFGHQFNGIFQNLMKARTHNILNERNPELPS
jgi:NAD(P)-dependent dehydrogenase (short-subunit alcohol dehydrogenase family)